ncbi:NADP-dependent oxidoreductase [Phytohabitans sp. ZYX-F-186]|uniref:NADP-dependent oxidoreductase n=1 Tax=Phytohabitans maris TaxID=3071409 RepID=A0ABU0ZP34_9ACTN|nr:NADP-dependent oxidoreductase [Phytohabitans sp. ZYX-F-186]MDQ7908000.1 NADP-dependent oxidoreductase [Phytohabitans sp. ZYX-F-186]
MRAVTITEYGGPEVLRVTDQPLPEPGPGQLRVRVRAAPVQPVDLATGAGAFADRVPPRPPFVPGWDLAGTVDAVGEGVTGFRPGDEVVGMRHWFHSGGGGTQAEYALLDAAHTATAPAGVEPAAAATLPLNALTAAQALDLTGLTAGTIAVTGAAGAVGAYAAQLAVHRGLTVYAVAGAQDEEFVRGIGAVFVPRARNVAAAVRAAAGGPVDAAFDPAFAGAPVLGAVRDGGTFVAGAGPLAPPPERGIRTTGVEVEPDGDRLATLVALAERGGLALRVAATLPLSEAATAHALLAKGGVRGRLVLTP